MKSILFFLDRVQDLDLALPVLKETLKVIPGRVRVVLSDRLARRSPRAVSAISPLGAEWSVANHIQITMGWKPSLSKIGAVFTASESSARPHRASHKLILHANRAGIPTFTVQHGFENIGLTYFDAIHRPENTHIASGTIFIWGQRESLHPRVDAGVRARCVSVGCPKEIAAVRPVERPAGARTVVSVFENLHWHRYDDAYRESFLRDLGETARVFPDTAFFVKPHPDERWLARRGGGGVLRGLKNVVLADPADPAWEPYTASSFTAVSDAVITTPSTVALDAARVPVPTALVAYGLSLGAYAPLPTLNLAADWKRFVSDSCETDTRQSFLNASLSFARASLVEGNAASRIAQALILVTG